MIDQFQFKVIHAADIANYLDDLAALRIKVFREYPYLYEGDFNYEKKYLSVYLKSPQSMLIIAFFENKVIGISSALPLKDEAPELTAPFIKHKLDLNQFYYLGESVLLPEFRGRGIYKHFFAARESIAKEHGLKQAVFAAVKREDITPPINYIPLDNIWHRFGYQKNTLLQTQLGWKDIGKMHSTDKTMEFWMKPLC